MDKSKSENPDLILMDLSMPVMDGWDAIKIIKGDDAKNRYQLSRCQLMPWKSIENEP